MNAIVTSEEEVLWREAIGFQWEEAEYVFNTTGSPVEVFEEIYFFSIWYRDFQLSSKNVWNLWPGAKCRS